VSDLTNLSDAGGRLRVTVPGLRSDSVRAVAIEDAVDQVVGVRTVHAYPRTGSVVIWYSPTRCDTSAVLAAVSDALSTERSLVPARTPRSADIRNGEVLRIALGGAALALLGFRRYGLRRPALLGPTSRTFATGVTIFTGYPFLRGALRSLRGGKAAGTDLLVSAATVASLVLRENVVALTVLWLLNIGEYLQDLTLRRTRRAITNLLQGNQDTAWTLLDDGTEVQISIDSVRVGDQVIIHEQVAVPVDGEVVSGDAVVDQSAITGETLPVSITAGTWVHAGSVVIRGRLVVRAAAVGKDTTIGRIVTRVEEAQQHRAPIQTVGENFSRRFVPTSFLVSGLTLLLTGDVRRAMTMLLVACPCAVGLSTPTAISAAIGNGARRGILIKGGAHLEEAGRVDAVVFDKTGTLTNGRPVVTNIVSFHDAPRTGTGVCGQFGNPLPASLGRGRHPVHRGTSYHHPASRGVRGSGGAGNAHSGRRPHPATGQPGAVGPGRGGGQRPRQRMGQSPAPGSRDAAAARRRRHPGGAHQPARRSAPRVEASPGCPACQGR